MNTNLEKQLFDRYPAIFEREQSPACGDGWYILIDTLCDRLQWSTTETGTPQVIARQVKGKFGGLRFYVHERSDLQEGMIRLAEAMSYRICDVCGSYGELRGPVIARTRCDKHVDTRRL